MTDGHLINETYNDGVAADSYHDYYDYDAVGKRIEGDVYTSSNPIYNYYAYNADVQLADEANRQPSLSQANLHYRNDPNVGSNACVFQS